LRIGSLSEGEASLDHEATWLLGHIQNITFLALRSAGGDLLVDGTLHARCRYLRLQGTAATCGVHGFTGPAPARTDGPPQLRRLGGDRFAVVEKHQLVERSLPEPPRSLPVLEGENPCATARCRTADHVRGSACCRDLQVEIICGRADTKLEALVRSRLSPYLCKISRENDATIDVEMISACGYLDDAGGSCTLHGRSRSDGRAAKPDLCSEWPENGQGLHPACVFQGTSSAGGG
jgi:hypothetical protein